jgi:hypothetical protein
MREEGLYVALIKVITEVFLDHIKSESETLKIITVGVHAALKTRAAPKSRKKGNKE